MSALEAFLLKDAGFKPFVPKPITTQNTFLPRTPSFTHNVVAAPDIEAPQIGPSYSADNELKMWHEWKKSGKDPKKLEPLLRSMRPMLIATKNRYSGVDIPPRLIEAEAEVQFIESLRTYDPNKGAKLSTHVRNGQKRVDRFVKTNQNMARIVESRAQKWGDYLAAKQLLTEQLGREPTSKELARKMSINMGRNITPKEAERYMREDRRDLVQTGLDQNAFVHMPTPDRMILKIVEEELTNEEKAVFERIFGLNGSPKQEPGQIARSLRIHPSKVSRIKKSIQKKIEAYY